MHRFSPLPKLPLLVCVSVGVSMGLSVGCGDSKPKASKSSIAAAFENQVDPAANAKKADEDMRRLKEKVAADAEAAVLAEIDKITTPAADAPNDIKAACEGMRGAYDQFMQKRLAGDKVELDRWNVMKPLDLDKVVEACVTGNQAKVAACQHNAFANASPEIGRDRVETLLTTCTKKFGQPLAAAPAGKPKSAG